MIPLVELYVNARLSFVRAICGKILVCFSFLELLCRPSSLDAIFLAHGLVVLHALPVSININYL